MSDKAHAASGRVLRVKKDLGGAIPAGQLFAVAVGDNQQALAHFKRAYPLLEVEIVGDLSEYCLQDLGLKPGRLVPL
jgi:hypothetical protein